jgi:hypothetical protein
MYDLSFDFVNFSHSKKNASKKAGLSRINLRTIIAVLASRKPCLCYTRQNISESLLLQMRHKLLAHNWMVHFICSGVKVYTTGK